MRTLICMYAHQVCAPRKSDQAYLPYLPVPYLRFNCYQQLRHLTITTRLTPCSLPSLPPSLTLKQSNTPTATFVSSPSSLSPTYLLGSRANSSLHQSYNMLSHLKHTLSRKNTRTAFKQGDGLHQQPRSTPFSWRPGLVFGVSEN